MNKNSFSGDDGASFQAMMGLDLGYTWDTKQSNFCIPEEISSNSEN
tara:strand:+ start:1015 stop:1152 length:138 start_codon:yes stop_codon:yes gene_type:complete